MTIYSYGYRSSAHERQNEANELKLFCDNLTLILQHKDEILANRNYFFCPLSFAWCSWAYISGDGPLCLGHLLLGWQCGVLSDKCADCAGSVLIKSFGGSILSGSNSWFGVCTDCKSQQKGAWKTFGDRAGSVLYLRKNYPGEVSDWEEYEGSVFSWGNSGLKPARKRRLTVKRLADRVTLDALIADLKNGVVRKGHPPVTQTTERDITLKFSGK